MPKKSVKRSINLDIADIFWEMADILEMKNVEWKPRAYRAAAQTIESLRYSLEEIYTKEGEEGIDKLPGIGEGLTKKIIEYIKTSKIKEYEKLKKSLPGGLYDMMKIPGVGVKRARLFYEKLGIKSVVGLKKAVKQGRLRELEGFKERAEKKVLEGIGMKELQIGRLPYLEAKKIADEVAKELKKVKDVQEVIITGSLRRKKSGIGDIDIAVKTKNPKEVIDKFVKMKFVKKVLGKGEKKGVVVHDSGVQVDVRASRPENFGATVLYFTGDKQHDIWMRRVAIGLGYKLNEYGLYDRKTGKQIAGKTEKEIYDKLGLKYVKPEKRVGEVKS